MEELLCVMCADDAHGMHVMLMSINVFPTCSPSIIECFAVSTAIISQMYVVMMSAINVYVFGVIGR